MKTQNITPTPWTVKIERGHSLAIVSPVVQTGEGRTDQYLVHSAYKVRGADHINSAKVADAALILAAPLLLEALIELAQATEQWATRSHENAEVHDAAMAAIHAAHDVEPFALFMQTADSREDVIARIRANSQPVFANRQPSVEQQTEQTTAEKLADLADSI